MQASSQNQPVQHQERAFVDEFFNNDENEEPAAVHSEMQDTTDAAGALLALATSSDPDVNAQIDDSTEVGSKRVGTFQQAYSEKSLARQVAKAKSGLSSLLSQEVGSKSLVVEYRVGMTGKHHVNILHAPQGAQIEFKEVAKSQLGSKEVRQIFQKLADSTDTPEAVSTLLTQIETDGRLSYKLLHLLETVHNLKQGFWMDSTDTPASIDRRGQKHKADSNSPGELDWVVKILIEYVVAVGCASQPFGMRFLHRAEFLHDMLNGQGWSARAGRGSGSHKRVGAVGRVMSFAQCIVAAVAAEQASCTAGQEPAKNRFVTEWPVHSSQQSNVEGEVAERFVDNVRGVLFGCVHPLSSAKCLKSSTYQGSQQASDVALNSEYPFTRPSFHHFLLPHILSCLVASAKLIRFCELCL